MPSRELVNSFHNTARDEDSSFATIHLVLDKPDKRDMFTEDYQFLVPVLVATAVYILVRWQFRSSKARKTKTIKGSEIMTLKHREIPPPEISLDLVRALLYAKSEEEFKKLLEKHPELQKFDEVGMPMHEALNMLLIPEQDSDTADKSGHVVMISEMQPGISTVVTKNSTGKHIANLFEIPADILTQMMLVTPIELQLWVARTLQVSLHHPEYLTQQSYWMLGEIVSSPSTKEESRPKISRLHKALGLCLEYGLDQEWILTIRGNHL